MWPCAVFTIETMLRGLSKRDAKWLSRFREGFEGSDAGRKAIATSPNRRLYAVLRPTKLEDLERIRNVLLAMGPDQYQRVLERAEKIQKGAVW